jgi:hypothetical protein
MVAQTSSWIVRRLGHLDGILLTLVLLLLGVSLAVVASASGQSPARISGHLINIGLALGVMVVMANVPPHLLSRVGPLVAGGQLPIGWRCSVNCNGARRWLIWAHGVQPSNCKLRCPDAGLVFGAQRGYVPGAWWRRAGSGAVSADPASTIWYGLMISIGPICCSLPACRR